MARFYANENLPLMMVKGLRKLGHDVLTSQEVGNANKGIPDPEVLAYAHQTHRIMITFNRNDFIELHNRGIIHSGIIIAKDNREYQPQVEIIDRFLTKVGEDISNQLIRVLKQNKPQSPQQIFVIRQYQRR